MSSRSAERRARRLWLWGPVVAALAVRLALYVAAGLWAAGPAHPHVLQRDPVEYHLLARAMAEDGAFRYDAADPLAARRHTDYEVAPLRTPGYPAFLAASYAVFGPWPAVPLAVQLLLEGATCLLLALALRPALGARGAGLAALAYALHPGAALFANTLYSETLFTLLLVAAFAVLLTAGAAEAPARGVRVRVVVAGLLLGLAALVRPVLQYFPLVVVLYLLWTFRGQWKLALGLGAAFAVAFAVPLVPWAARNAAEHGHFALSTSGPYNLLALYAAPLEIAATGADERAVLDTLMARADASAHTGGVGPRSDFDRAPYWSAEAAHVFAARPGAFVRSQVVGAVRLWVSVGRVYRDHLFGESGGHPPFQGGARGLARWWGGQRPYDRVLDAWAVLYALAVYPLLAWGVVAGGRGWRGAARPVRLALGLAALVALYLIVVTGTPGHSRFMAPIVPFWAPFVAVGAERLGRRFAR